MWEILGTGEPVSDRREVCCMCVAMGCVGVFGVGSSVARALLGLPSIRQLDPWPQV